MTDKIKAFLTVTELLDRCLLNGIEDPSIADTEPIRIVSINNTPLKNNVSGICTIGFIRSQLQRRRVLAQQIEQWLLRQPNQPQNHEPTV